jgi:hypothetical protein
MSDNFEPARASGDKGIGVTRTEFEKSEPASVDRFDSGSFLRRQLPYILLLGLAIIGVAYTNMAHQPLVGYWEFLALATGLVCIVTEWPKLDDRQARPKIRDENLEDAAALAGKGFSAHCGQCNGG